MKNRRDGRSRRALEELHRAVVEREGRLRMALEAAEMVTWEWDLLTNTVQYSDNMATLVAGETIDPYCTISGVLETIHPDDRDGLARALDRTVKKGTPFVCEYRVMMQDGAYHWILGKGKTVLVEKGKPVRVLGVSLDITARKVLEQELQRRTQQLAELAAQLTIAEQRERQHCADLLHEDLQQILVGARMLVDCIDRQERGARKRSIRRLDSVLEQAQFVARSVTRILYPPLSLQKELPHALRWLANDMRQRHQLAVAVRAAAAIPPLPEAVAVLVFTAARELLLNIVKHAGTRRARMCLRRSNVAVALEVRDEGRGNDARGIAGASFDRGLGLFSIRERAELLGGALVLDSAPGRGMRVLLTLPIGKVERETGIEPATFSLGS